MIKSWCGTILLKLRISVNALHLWCSRVLVEASAVDGSIRGQTLDFDMSCFER